MRTLTSFFLSVALCSFSLTGNARAATPDEIAANVRVNGAKATVQMLTSTSGGRDWNFALRGIKTGSPSWLATARALAAGTDAGTSEDLQVSLATALPKNPAGVLLLVDAQSFLSLQDLCGAPFIEPSHAFLVGYLKQARHALRNLKDPGAEPRRSACLAEIDQALREELSRGVK